MRRLIFLSLALFACDDGDAGGTVDAAQRDMRVRRVIVDAAQPTPDGGADSTFAVADDQGVDAGPDRDAGRVEPDAAEPPVGCVEGETRPCPAGGVQACEGGEWTPCEPAGDELCNAADDDADGTIDEGFAGLGTECTELVDGCNQAGILVCAEDGMGVRCLTMGDGPQAEACDGIDNDCDNQVDEGFPGRSCCTEDVHCPVGARCVDGECSAPPAPECMSPLDCPIGQQCVNGVCEEAPPPGGCMSALDCFPGQRCENGQCVANQGGPCQDDFDCFGFEQCFDGMCREAQPGECRDAFDCFGDPCIDGVCAPGACVDEFDCGLFELCLDGLCQEPPPGACLNNFQCPDGALCIENMCVEGACRDDFDCDRPTRCVDNLCSDAPRGMANCMGAVEMEAFGAFQADTRGVANEHWSTCVEPADGGEAIYTFQFDRPADVRIDTAGSSFDTVLSVRTDCGALGSEIACNDDAGGGQSAVAFEAQADTRYWVIVDGFRGASGDVVLNFAGDLACVDDAECDGACVDGRCRPPLSCDAAVPVDAAGVFQGNTANRPDDVVPACGAAGGGELVYALQFAADTPVRVDTVGSDYDTLISLRTDCADVASEFACNDDGGGAGSPSELAFNATADTPYFLIVDGFRGRTGNATVNVRAPGPRDPAVARCDDCAEPRQCVNTACVPAAPGACAGAAPSTGFAGLAGDTAGGGNDFASSCTPASTAPDAVVAFALPYAARVRIDTDGSDFDTVLSVLGADCATVLACDDDGGDGNRSAVTLQIAAGAPYYVVVDGYGDGASGAYRLNFTWLE